MSQTKSIVAAVLGATLIGLAPATQAAVIYDEAVDGDAPQSGGSVLIGATVNVPDGVNTILGLADFEFDDFILVVPVGGTLLSITLSARLVDGPILVFDGIFWGPGGVALDTWSTLDPVIAGPFGPGTYKIDNVFASGSISYEWTLNAVVPEAPTLALLGFGLAGLGWSRRRR